MDIAFSKTTEEVVAYFGVDERTGLTDDQVKRNTEKYGPNGKIFSILIFCKQMFDSNVETSFVTLARFVRAMAAIMEQARVVDKIVFFFSTN